MNIVAVVLGILNVYELVISVFDFVDPLTEYVCFDSCTLPGIIFHRSLGVALVVTNIRGESSSNGSAGFTPQKLRAELSSNVSSLKLGVPG